MKLLTAFVFLMSTLVVHQDVEAQSRGNSGPGRGGVGPSRPSGPGRPSTPSRPNNGGYTPSRPSTPNTPSRPNNGGYNPNRPSTPNTPSRPNNGGYTPSRPSTPNTPSRPNNGGYTPNRPSTPNTPSRPGPVVNRPNRPSTPNTPSRPGPVVNRPNRPSTPTRGPVVTRPGTTTPRYYPRPSTPSYRVPGSRYNRPPTYGRIPGTQYRPIRTHYGTRFYHRPYGYTPVRYVHYYHVPYRAPIVHTIRYYRTYDWYTYVFRVNVNYIYAHWIFWPQAGYTNGYWVIDNYPYYVYNGYRYRYSTVDYCNYQLVDSHDHRVVQTYWNQLCNVGYDSCSYERDRLNAQMNEYRYFCSETWRDYGFDYSVPTYDDTFYTSEVEEEDDYTTITVCSDRDNDGYCDRD